MMIFENDNILVERLEIEIEHTGHKTNCYVILDKSSNKVLVIDPAFDENTILKEVDKLGGKIDNIVITHAHADHIAALSKLVENTDAKVFIEANDFDGLFDFKINEEQIVGTKVLPVKKENVVTVKDMDKITMGNTELEIIHTPGHTKGSICLYDKNNNLLYSGDTIFENTYGRTDLITGSHDDMKLSLDKIFNRFENILVLPGHGILFELSKSKRKIRLLFAYKG